MKTQLIQYVIAFSLGFFERRGKRSWHGGVPCDVMETPPRRSESNTKTTPYILRVLGSASLWRDPAFNNFFVADPALHFFESFTTLTDAQARVLALHSRKIETADPSRYG